MKSAIARLLLAATSMWLLGCDDVLEACQGCPEAGRQVLAVAGDPRLDRTLEAAVQFGKQHRDASRRLSRALQDASAAFGVDIGQQPLSIAAVEALWSAAKSDLTRGDVEISLASEPAVCQVDAATLTETMLACQEHIGCYVSIECRNERLLMPKMLCAGLCSGPCDTVCDGACLLAERSGGSACDGACLGACVADEPGTCGSTCVGTCDGTCSASSPDGRCQGHCSGVCMGACVGPTLQTCTGVCHGRCAASSGGTCAAPSSCFGRCEGDGCFESCRGLVEPAVCDPQYCDGPDDATAIAQCRAAVRDLSVAQVECRGGRAVIVSRFAGDFPEDGYALLERWRTLAEALEVALDVEAWGKFVGLGQDEAAEMSAEWLGYTGQGVSDGVQDADWVAAAVPSSLASAPAWSLKLRTFALSKDGVASSFDVVAGAATCVSQAFKLAFDDLDRILPAKDQGGGDVEAIRPAESLLALVDVAAAFTAPLK